MKLPNGLEVFTSSLASVDVHTELLLQTDGRLIQQLINQSKSERPSAIMKQKRMHWQHLPTIINLHMI